MGGVERAAIIQRLGSATPTPLGGLGLLSSQRLKSAFDLETHPSSPIHPQPIFLSGRAILPVVPLHGEGDEPGIPAIERIADERETVESGGSFLEPKDLGRRLAA